MQNFQSNFVYALSGDNRHNERGRVIVIDTDAAPLF